VELVEQALSGSRRAIARLITLIENEGDGAPAAIVQLYPFTGRAYVIGVTGAPGTGKSTLVNELVKSYRAAGHRVAVVAVDATSPFTGGAILGDRVRMGDLDKDPDVFVRSMATRGNLGGLAWTTADVVKVLDAVGYDTIFIETVGTGQVEVEIAQMAHTVVVVEMPGMGDEVQSIKAGILEIGDVFVVNKSDREGVERTVAGLEMMLNLGRANTSRKIAGYGYLMPILASQETGTPHFSGEQTPAGSRSHWQPLVVKTVATQGNGIPELAQAIDSHRDYLEASKELQRRNQARLVNEVERIVRHHMMNHLLDRVDRMRLIEIMSRVVTREVDPHTAARQLVHEARG